LTIIIKGGNNVNRKGWVLILLSVFVVYLCGQGFAEEISPNAALVAQHESPGESTPGATTTTTATTTTETPGASKGMSALGWLVTISALASALGIGIATLGPGIGQGNAVARAMEAIGRNPEAQSKIMPTLLIGLAFMESLVLYALLVSLVLLFINPFLKYVGAGH
jgi:F-type H+-transporting ATPase subunit c